MAHPGGRKFVADTRPHHLCLLTCVNAQRILEAGPYSTYPLSSYA